MKGGLQNGLFGSAVLGLFGAKRVRRQGVRVVFADKSKP